MNKALLLAVVACASLAAAPCTSGPLSTYAVGGFTCTIDQFTFQDFYFGVGAYSTGYTPIGASDITVAPALSVGVNGAVLGLSFSSTLFSVSGSEFVNYQIRYNIDPPPDVIIETDDQLNTNTPVAPGYVDIITKVCVGGLWGGTPPLSFCDITSGIRTLHVFHNGTPTGTVQAFDSTSFPGVHVLGIDNYIALYAMGSSSSFTGITNSTTATPEPAAGAFVIFGLGLLAARRLRAKVR